MQITVSGLGPNDMYMELTQEQPEGRETWVRIKMGYKDNAPVLNTGVNLSEGRSLSHALQAIADR